MKIFLTGGSGLVGSHFLKHALAAGHTVLSLRRSQFSSCRIPIDQQPDWLDRQLENVMAEDLCECDVLMHFAAHSVQYPFDTILNCMQWNLMAVLSLFEQARLAGIRRYVVAGSFFEYGRSGEWYDAIPTDAPLKPTNSYGASKAAASIALLQWAEEHLLDLEILRIFHVYGEGEAPTRFWPSLRHAALTGQDFPMTAGEQIRNFLPVENVASLFLQRATQDRPDLPKVNVFNVGTLYPHSLIAFAEYWWSTWNAKGRILKGSIPYRDNEVMRCVAGENLLTIKDNLIATEIYPASVSNR